MFHRRSLATLEVPLREGGQATAAILADRFDERQMAAAGAAAQLHAVLVLAPIRHVGHEIDAERAAAIDDPTDRVERGGEIRFTYERLENPVRRNHHRERPVREGKRTDVAANDRDSGFGIWDSPERDSPWRDSPQRDSRRRD